MCKLQSRFKELLEAVLKHLEAVLMEGLGRQLWLGTLHEYSGDPGVDQVSRLQRVGAVTMGWLGKEISSSQGWLY